MISELALNHFAQLWDLFDGKMFDAKGSMFLIEPFRMYFPTKYVQELTAKTAHDKLHENMQRWGQIEQKKHEIEVIDKIEFPNGGSLDKTQFKDPEVRWAREFILLAFYNIDCLATYKSTIEELIFFAFQYRIPQTISSTEAAKAYHKLLTVSRSFLLAEWSHDIIKIAIANNDDFFFEKFTRLQPKFALESRFDTARRWLAITMLWYLGGKNISPRREFIKLLERMGIQPHGQEEPSFNSELSKLRLI